MNPLTPGEETMIAALSRQVRDRDWAACGTLSPMPAAALWLAKLTHAPKAEVFVAGSRDWPFSNEWQDFFDLAQAGRLNVFFLSGAQIDGQGNINLMAVGDYRLARYGVERGLALEPLPKLGAHVPGDRFHEADDVHPGTPFPTAIMLAGGNYL